MAETTHTFLSDVPSSNYFVLSNGRSIPNLESLFMILQECDDGVFYNHVNGARNDFANWIKYCILYTELSDKLMPIRDKKEFLRILGEDITKLKTPVATIPESIPSTATIPVPSVAAVSAPPQPAVVQPTAAASVVVPENDGLEFEEVFTDVVSEIEKEIFS
jgi:hypothetical protein